MIRHHKEGWSIKQLALALVIRHNLTIKEAFDLGFPQTPDFWIGNDPRWSDDAVAIWMDTHDRTKALLDKAKNSGGPH